MDKETFERVEKHFYKRCFQMKSGQWSVAYYWCLRDWTGKNRRERLSGDLEAARKLLRRREVANDEHRDLDADKKARSAMTVKKWVEVATEMPQMAEKESADRDEQLYSHIVRLLGDKQLTEITRGDLFGYLEQRRKETLFRGGRWTKTPVKDGTIRIELAGLRHLLNLAKENDVPASAVSFKGVLPDANHRQRILRDTEKTKLLTSAPRWLQRLIIVGVETALSRGDLLRLRWEDVDEENGVVVPNGGRIKTNVRQAAPLTLAVREILDEIRVERAKMKVEPIDSETRSLVFIKDGEPIDYNALHKAFTKASKRAGIKDFNFHDLRHTAKTAWARAGIPVEAAMLAAGHASVQMHLAYTHLQKSDVGRAFGTSQEFYQAFNARKNAGKKQ